MVLGFHGTCKSVAEEVINRKSHLKFSKKAHEWLGHGVYFWENDQERALEYAKAKMLRKVLPGEIKIEHPIVIGAVLDLGFCLDLLNYNHNKLLETAHAVLEASFISTGNPMPQNRAIAGMEDLIDRQLDCSVIEELHKIRELNSPENKSFQSVRAAFWEGKEIYPNAGFRAKNHIQICIRDMSCIKGYFYPL